MSSSHSDVNMKTINEVEGEEDYSPALYLTTLSVLPMVMRSVIELDVLDIIASAGPNAQLSPSQIASHLPTQNPVEASMMLDRMLRLMASHSLVTCSNVSLENGLVERCYGLASMCKYFVRDQDGVSMSPMMMMILDKVFMESWYHLKDAVLDGGIPFNKAHGMNSYQYPSTDPRFNHVFNKAMFNYTSIVMKKILETYKGFDDVKRVVDVGGGIGTAVSIVVSKYPAIEGVNFDLPHVVQNAPSYLGVEQVGGDMFVNIPKCDAIFMKGIFHNWNDEHCMKLLKNCYEALPENGKVIIVDRIIPTVVETDSAAKGLFQFDLMMMVHHHGGKERTEEEFKAIAKKAGFASAEIALRPFKYWVVMELIK
ncbi:hypothetical protein IFM89_003656 [Coptis chinensis]|uniref:Uncharacterized protein n=1 Tax=Coptis chinensis TaxID=261450 RepID=A0A835HKP8_9MAGN|nr:hypothetical protein IFM89_003656 [Coptis chinensis]